MKFRSILFVPGHEEKKIKKAYTLDADLVVIDLEFTVPDNEKQNARKIIRNCKVDKKKTYIRINNIEDLDFVVEEEFIGIFLPFTESREQLLNIDKILKSNEKLKTDIIPIIESEKGIENLKEICDFKERIKVISFGSHDLAKSINLKVSDDENEILNYRKLIVSHSKDPIDTSYLNFKDLKGFEKSCNVAKSIGFAGKACIHPGQVDISNKIF